MDDTSPDSHLTASDSRLTTLAWPLRCGVLLLLLLAGWTLGTALRDHRAEGWPPRSRRLRVLTTILPLYDFARQVGGPDVEVRNLLPPGVDPHEFALSPRDVNLVAGADLLIANGGGLDDFLSDALRRVQVTNQPVVRAVEGLPMRESAEHEEHAGHGHEAGDPHMWLDPVYARVYARRIAMEIAREMERRNERQYASAVHLRAARLDAELVKLDRDYRLTLAPYRGRTFVAFHGAFAYMAARYGLVVAAVWQTTPGREPAPREVGEILTLARRQGVRALFTEPQFSSRALEMIAADAALPVYKLDPFETAMDFERADYLAVMRRNLETLRHALGRP